MPGMRAVRVWQGSACVRTRVCCVVPTEPSVWAGGGFLLRLSRLGWLATEIPGWRSPGGSVRWTVSLLWM